MTPSAPEWAVEYEIRSGIDANSTVVATGTARVSADSQEQAHTLARAWVHDNDAYADPRIDPTVRIVSAHRLDEAD